jgi:hypothetical protein
MSTCISRHGEYGSHTFSDDEAPFVCQHCFVFDEAGAVAALAAAVERATRAEAERAEFRDIARRRIAEVDKLRAQVAKVRGMLLEVNDPDGWTPYNTHDIGPAFLAESVQDLVNDILDALGSVGATEGEADHDHGEWSKDEQRYEDGCKTGAPASPAAAEPERACPRPEAHHYQPEAKP